MALTFPRSSDAAGRVREELRRELQRAPAPAPGDVVLLASELVTNSVRHGGGTHVRVRAVIDEECARVEVCDGGTGFSAFGPLRLPDPSRIGGRGLYIVDRVASRWGSRHADGQACVWFEIEA